VAGSLPEEGSASVPVHGTSPWGRGEQKEWMGILTPGGTSWWRGSDVQASVKGGGGGASSMRRCSSHGSEERGAEMSAVEMIGVWRPFIGSGRRWRGAEVVGRRGGF
jgi:hypothetical protein